MAAYRRAAQGYLAYGVVYLFGAASQLTPERQHDFYGIPWWAFFVVGAALVASHSSLICTSVTPGRRSP